jgi:hypothetical protein
MYRRGRLAFKNRKAKTMERLTGAPYQIREAVAPVIDATLQIVADPLDRVFILASMLRDAIGAVPLKNRIDARRIAGLHLGTQIDPAWCDFSNRPWPPRKPPTL